MCVLAIAWRAHPRWRLVVAANRDELHDRPAAPLARWANADVIAGRDLRAMGTWLGVSESGRFAAVTNLRGFGAADPTLRSRGALVADMLEGAALPSIADFNPCHAVVVAPAGATVLSNRPDTSIAPLASGVHAISNGPMHPPWRKADRLRAAVEAWLTANDALERFSISLHRNRRR